MLPQPGNLIEFELESPSEFRFYIDAASLSVGADGVVRYVLVARSPAGVDNVSFEGMRCRPGLVRIYALGRPDGSWSERRGEWREIDARGLQRWHGVLRREYFCPLNLAIRDAAEGISILRQGGYRRPGH